MEKTHDEQKETDEALLLAIQGGALSRYAEIMQRYTAKLTRYLKKFIHDQDELEDVLQDVFIKTYKNIFGFNPKKRFSPWIYRIAHNQALNHIKKRKEFVVSIDAVDMILVDRALGPDRAYDNDILKKNMEETLSKMKNKYRDPLILFFFEQKTYEEISDILEIPVSTVGTRIRRARGFFEKTFKK